MYCALAVKMKIMLRHCHPALRALRTPRHAGVISSSPRRSATRRLSTHPRQPAAAPYRRSPGSFLVGLVQHFSRPPAPVAAVFPGRHFSAMPDHQQQQHEEGEEEESQAHLPFLVRRLNAAIRNHPQESLASLLGLEIATMFSCYGAIQASGVDFPPEFALAFALSRPLRRLRFPVEIAAAGALSRAFPSLRAIEISKLVNVVPKSVRSAVSERTSGPSDDGGSGDGSTSIVGRGLRVVQGTVDRYGAAYFVGARMVGVSIVFVLYQALRMGVDVAPMLEQLGVSEVGSVLGDWAGAVVLSSSLYPVSISMTAFAAPALARLRRRVLSS